MQVLQQIQRFSKTTQYTIHITLIDQHVTSLANPDNSSYDRTLDGCRTFDARALLSWSIHVDARFESAAA